MHSGTAAGISRNLQHASPFARQASVAALGVGRLLRTNLSSDAAAAEHAS
jgi:hypothetical protein